MGNEIIAISNVKEPAFAYRVPSQHSLSHLFVVDAADLEA